MKTQTFTSSYSQINAKKSEIIRSVLLVVVNQKYFFVWLPKIIRWSGVKQKKTFYTLIFDTCSSRHFIVVRPQPQ